MSFQLSLSVEEYNDFLRCLSNITEICNDIDIKGGFIRQRSNDRSTVLEFDLTSILTTANMAISDIKKKYELLQIFSGQEVSIVINEEQNETPGDFTISDNMSSLKFISPSSRFIDNQYMDQEELNRIFVTNPEELILDYEIQTKIADRIKTIAKNFNVKIIQVNIDGESASITSTTQAKDQFAKFVENVPTNMSLEDCSVNLSTIPFCIEHDTDLNFKMYKDSDQDISYNRVSTTIGSINVVAFTRSNILKNEE